MGFSFNACMNNLTYVNPIIFLINEIQNLKYRFQQGRT
jgi:hypothetical protein